VRALPDRVSIFKEGIFSSFKPEEYVNERYQETIAEVPLLRGEDPLESRRREMFYLNMVWFMNTLLERKDRMSMATGLEVRVPFCDHRLVEYLWNIPWEIKNCDGRAKGILRRALQGILPQDVLERRKSPYPKTHNPNYLTAVRDEILAILNEPKAPLLALIDERKVHSLLQSTDELFDRPWFGQLMKGPQLYAYLIQLNTWLKEYKVQLN
jgi:asparagine synthase (glutamine-hydrolysing)